jgi:hypothetical protein
MKKEIKKCKHLKRDWCLNCDMWYQPPYCMQHGHQDPIQKCVNCGEYFDPDNSDRFQESRYLCWYDNSNVEALKKSSDDHLKYLKSIVDDKEYKMRCEKNKEFFENKVIVLSKSQKKLKKYFKTMGIDVFPDNPCK